MVDASDEGYICTGGSSASERKRDQLWLKGPQRGSLAMEGVVIASGKEIKIYAC